MPSTARGFPYPNATDPVSSGAANFQALAAALDAYFADLALAQVTAAVQSAITAAATAPTLITAPAVSLNGTTKIKIEFFCPTVGVNVAALAYSWLFDGTTQIGVLCQSNQNANEQVPHYGHVFITPASGSHVYSARGVVSGGTGTWGAGTVSPLPMTLRVIRTV